MSYEPSLSLHQQNGGMSVQAFAALEGLTLKQARYCIKNGKVLGAQRDSRSKKWWIYPPAVLMERPRSYSRSKKSERVAPPSGASDMAGVLPGHAVTHPKQQVEVAAEPLLADQQPQAVLSPFKRPEVLAVCKELKKAAARQLKNSYRLKLNALEIVQLVEAVGNDRRRMKQAIGKGAKQYGELRATDALWHKLQTVLRHFSYEVQS